jgi:hypothetical protein
MEFALTIVAIVSAVTALVMAGIVVSMLRTERRRSDARVEALRRLANSEAASASADGTVFEPVPVRVPVAAAVSAPVAHVPPKVSDDFTDEPFAEWDLRPDVAGVGGLFVEPEQSSPWTRRIGIAAAVALAATIVGFTVSSFSRSRATDTPAPAPVVAQDGNPTLELLTLSYEQKEGALTISGMVQNPRSSAAVAAGVEVTALVFGADGTVVASANTPLDFSRLRPGDESPFVVRVPVSGAIARYRIGFRGNDGRVIGHVDRRSASPLARNE